MKLIFIIKILNESEHNHWKRRKGMREMRERADLCRVRARFGLVYATCGLPTEEEAR